MYRRLVVIGLGYVGLPLAVEAQLAGLDVVGLDTSDSVVADLTRGRSHVDDITDEQLASAIDAGLKFTSDSQCLGEADVVVICVPTPLTHDGRPELRHVESAAATLSSNIRQGQLVILESTTYPGTTEDVLVPLLEKSGLKFGSDFFCAFSPERIDPGNSEHGIANTPKIVGGVDQVSTDRAVEFYSAFIRVVVRAKGAKEAELAKLLENTYRHVNIALMNEMVRFCHELNIDLWDAIACAATKPFGFQAFYPGPGVGGHCIPIDPNYLSHQVRTHLGRDFRFVELAQEINKEMPAYVARRTQDLLNTVSVAINGARVLLLGVTYKANVADQRESPAVDLYRALRYLGAEVLFHDPFVEAWSVDGEFIPRLHDWWSENDGLDAVVLVQDHDDYLASPLWPLRVPTLDTRGRLVGESVCRL